MDVSAYLDLPCPQCTELVTGLNSGDPQEHRGAFNCPNCGAPIKLVGQWNEAGEPLGLESFCLQLSGQASFGSSWVYEPMPFSQVADLQQRARTGEAFPADTVLALLARVQELEQHAQQQERDNRRMRDALVVQQKRYDELLGADLDYIERRELSGEYPETGND